MIILSLSFSPLAFGEGHHDAHRNKINRDARRGSVLEGKRCIGAHLHGVSSSPWARRSTRRGEPASGEKRRGEREREREKLFLYLSLVVSRRGCWEREKDSWRNQDEEEDFLLTCGFLLLCGGALRHPARTMHFSHTFSGFLSPNRLRLPVCQPRMQETRLRCCHDVVGFAVFLSGETDVN